MSAVIESPAIAEPTSSTLEQLALSAIAPAPDNPRRNLGDVSELAASMSELGVLQPLVVTPRGGKFLVVCGHRRHAAAKKAKLTTVPAIVRELTEPQRIKAMLIENCQRTDLSPIEEARAYQALVDLGVTQRQLAGDVGKTQSHISKRLALLSLPAKVLTDVDSGGITIGDALELAKLTEYPAALTEALKKMRDWRWPAATAVNEQLRDLERLKKVEAEIERVKASGIPYIKNDGNYSAPKGTMWVDPNGWDSLQMKIGAHSKLPCHAATVDRNGTRCYLCTDPKSHAGDAKAMAVVTRDRRVERSKAHQKEIRAAQRTRRAKVTEILKQRHPAGELLELLVLSLIRETWQSKRKIACELLGIDADTFKPRTAAGDHADKWTVALETEAAKPGRIGSVGLALAFSATEETIGRAHGWQGHGAYFEWLKSRGYEITPAEKLALNGKAPY